MDEKPQSKPRKRPKKAGGDAPPDQEMVPIEDWDGMVAAYDQALTEQKQALAERSAERDRLLVERERLRGELAALVALDELE